MEGNKGKSLTQEEQSIFTAIDKNELVLLKTLLTDKKNVNILDENSMTPLQHAAYKGNFEMVQTLLDQGADVNLCEHQHNYTALHFAALSGSVETCLALLKAGAKTNVLNTVGRTSSQMAAFVGHHNCVATINNYIPKEDIEIYTSISGSHTEPDLPPFLSESFHKFIMQVNVHPVKVVLNLHQYAGLMDHLLEVKTVLKLMSKKEMKKGVENNETLSFKFHYLSYVVGEVIKIKQKQNNIKTDDKKLDITELFSRKILKPGKDGSLEFMDAFLKESVREFEFMDSNLFRQMVATLASNESQSAISVISTAVNGQRGFIDNAVCTTCGEEKPTKKCSKCKAVNYCDRNCQRLHWHWHKKVCAKLSQAATEADKSTPDVNEISADLQEFLINSESS